MTAQVLDLIRNCRIELRDLFLMWRFTLSRTQRLINCERFSLWLLDAPSGTMWTHITAAGTGRTRIMRIPATAGVAGSCVRAARVLNIADCYSKEGPPTAAAAPRVCGRTSGVMVSVGYCGALPRSLWVAGLMQGFNPEVDKRTGWAVSRAHKQTKAHAGLRTRMAAHAH